MKMGRLAYFAEFLVFPPFVLLFTAFAFHGATPPRLASWALACLAGLSAWTLIEYLLHRFVFHHAPVLARMHARHHDEPLALIGTPAWVSVSLGAIAVAGPLWAMLGFDLATAVTAGMVGGYLFYVFIHYAIHHWQPRPGSYLARVRRWHALHHHFADEGNFGVTTSFWDHVFGTALESRRHKLHRNAN